MRHNQVVKVKICGITNIEDAMAASLAGADAIGFVFAKSSRQVSPKTAAGIINELDPFVMTVGVFVDAPVESVLEIKERCGLDIVQLHGKEDESYVNSVPGRVFKAVTPAQLVDVDAYPVATLLVDSPGGGTGKTVDWKSVAMAASKRKIVLAGGLNPDNVQEAINTVRPYAVDVSSGVEVEPGMKNHDAIRQFIKKVKSNG